MAKQTGKHSRTVAYAAISAALGTILLTIGAYTGLGEFFWYFAAGVCVMITFRCGSLLGAVMSFVVCSSLALLTTGFNFIFLLPYLIFFGAYPISLYIEKRYNANKILMIVITLIWFDAALYVMYLFTKLFVTDIVFINEYIIYIILIGGSLVFFGYRFVMKRVLAKLEQRFRRLI